MINQLKKAIKIGNLNEVKELIKVGVDLDYQNERGWTALMIAAQHVKCEEIVKELLKAGADLDIQNKNGETALEIAINHQNQKGAELIQKALEIKKQCLQQEEKDLRSDLFESAQNGLLKKVQSLLHRGAQIDAVDEEGRTALHQASKAGHLEVVQEFIKAGADVLKKNKEGKDAFNLAMEQGHSAVAKVIKEAVREKLRAKKVCASTTVEQVLLGISKSKEKS